MLEVHDLHKDYEGQPLLTGISFTVGARETVCLLGPSGSGKSTLLRLIAGLEAPERGQICWDGKDLADVPAHLRDFGIVFQDYALFPHLNVFENVAFGLRMRGRAQDEIAARVGEVLRVVNMAGFEHRAVTDLSGGEQQRVALARALAPRPRLLMFDEPLGALDRALREDLLDQLRAILHRTRIPAIYVTHDQEEALTIADRVLLLHDGQIARSGTPAAVWADPGSPWAAEFLGLGNVVSGRVLSGSSRVATPGGRFAFHCSHRHRAGDHVELILRPAGTRRSGTLKGIVEDVLARPEGFRIVLKNGLRFDLPKARRVGSRISVAVDVECLGPHGARGG